MLKTMITTLGLALALTAPNASKAAPFTEIGDAGRTLATANSFAGNTDISRIDGVKSVAGVDMFELYIENTADFFARVTRFDGIDTQLFLFDDAGFGVIANDDRNGGDPLSRLTGFVGASGLYYLAITGWDVDPISSLGEIFPDTFTGLLTATGPGGSQPLSGFNGSSYPGNGGDYRINIRGAFTSDYAQISEPATLALLGTALIGFAGARRRKRA